MALNFTHLESSNAMFDQMIRRFGIVTVMNAHIYDFDNTKITSEDKADEIVKKFVTVNEGKYVWATGELCKLDTLKIANVPQEGPTKTVTGGQYSNPLIKFGKTARLEMQDALGNAPAIEALCGGIVEGNALPDLIGEHTASSAIGALHFGSDYAGPKTIVGETFFIDQKSGQQVKAIIIFYQFLPDSIFNLTQDAEGDATVFDMNCDLLTTEISVSTKSEGVSTVHGVFYSIVDPALLA